jgi:gamma-glutamyltranspeptidase/glutathione hydrolase
VKHGVRVRLDRILTSMMDLGADTQTALEAPRWNSIQQGQGANWPHEGDGTRPSNLASALL